LTVTKTWLRQVMVGLALICHSSYRGVVEFLRDLLGIRISVGTVHHVLQLATQQASVLNRDQDLSGIRVGLHDEIFHDGKPVLAGVDAASTYCYLLVAAQHRDADTWGVHLLDATEQGLKPAYTIADAGQGLRAGQKAAWGDTPCHGDVFHIQRQCEGLANTLARLAKGATLRNYFTLRRHLDGSYLDLLQFFLNHRRFIRSRVAARTGKSPRELMTGHGHAHWLTLLGFGPVQPQRA
jgi:hypothetical protein